MLSQVPLTLTRTGGQEVSEKLQTHFDAQIRYFRQQKAGAGTHD